MNPDFRDRLLATNEATWIFLGQLLREDEEILYAFENPRERTLFEELRTIDGIGPKSAALLVGKIGLKGFKEILENPKAISTVKISGLGPKNLEKISLGLKQKKEHFLGIVGIQEGTASQKTSMDFSGARLDLEKALLGLGVKSSEAKDLFAKMCEQDPSFQEMPLQQLLQEALKWWGRARAPVDANRKDKQRNEKSL